MQTKLALFAMVIFLNCFKTAQCQTQNNQRGVTVLPPAPNAAELGKYGDVPIGLFTGAMQYTLPLYELNTNHLSVPIQLSYSSNGVKVDQTAGNVGMSWSMNAGGVITRNIMGGDDFKQGALVAAPRDLSLANSFNSPDQQLTDFLWLAAEWQNTQPDVFFFNFNGYSGKFVLDYTGKAVIMPYQNLKIKLNDHGLEHSFTITTPSGVQYLFEKVEWTKYLLEGPCAAQASDERRESAWYLTHIIHPNKDQIDFEYEDLTYTYYTSISESKTAPSTFGQGCYDQPEPVQVTSNICKSKSAVEGCILKEIRTFHGRRVVFDNTSRTDMPGNKKVNAVMVYTSPTAATPVTRYELSYQSDAYRLYLTAVTEKGNNNETGKTHVFEYNDMFGLPAPLSFAQDKYGYYNGTSSSTLTPKVEGHSLFSVNYNERASNGNYSTKGMLTKIKYPTGGSSVISYESHKGFHITNEPVIDAITYDVSTWGGQPGNPVYGQQIKELTFTTPASPGGGSSSINCSFRVLLRNYGIDIPDPYLRQSVFRLMNLNSGQYVTGYLKGTVGMPVSINGTLLSYNAYSDLDNELEYECTLNFNTSYKITLIVTGEDLLGNIFLGGAWNTGQTTPIEHVTDYGGARVESVTNFDESGAQSSFKHYEYRKWDDQHPNASSAQIVSHYLNFQHCENRISCGGAMCNYAMLNFDQLSSSFIQHGLGGNHVYYSSVIESVGNNYEGGGIEHRYMVSSDEPAATLNSLNPIVDAPLSNTGYMNGMETYTRYFKRIGNNIQTVREVINTYNVNTVQNSAEIPGYFVIRKYPIICEDTPAELIELYKVAAYKHISHWVTRSKVQTIEHDNLLNTLSTTEDYAFSPTNGLIASTSKTNSKGAVRTISYKYPENYPGNAPYDSMVARQMVDYIVQQTETQNSTFLSEETTQYQFTDATKAIIAPQIITLRNLSAPAESSHEFHQYDSHGNILEYSKANDVREVLVWGYNQQYPVAKIIGASYAEVIGLVSQAILNNPLSDQQLRDELQNIRTSLPNALVTSITYSPQIGVTSETDPKGQTKYYEYDNFNRLKTIRDQEGKIVKQFDYKYQQVAP